MVYLHIKFQMPSSNISLVNPIRLKANENFRTADMLFYILQNKLP